MRDELVFQSLARTLRQALRLRIDDKHKFRVRVTQSDSKFEIDELVGRRVSQWWSQTVTDLTVS